MDYSTFLYNLGNFVWVMYLVLFVVVVLFNFADKSYLLGTLVLIISNLAMQLTEPVLVKLAEDFNHFIAHAWYLVWSIFSFISVVAIYLLHKRTNTIIGFESISYLLAFLAMCMLQLVRYFDRLVLETDVLGELYRVGVNSINIGCVLIVALPLLPKFVVNLVRSN